MLELLRHEHDFYTDVLHMSPKHGHDLEDHLIDLVFNDFIERYGMHPVDYEKAHDTDVLTTIELKGADIVVVVKG